MSSAKSALILLSEGSEEMEFVIAVDVLRRGGVDVTVAGLQGDDPHLCSRQVKILPDVSIKQAITKAPFDAIVLPGGLGGAKAFSESKEVGDLLKLHEKENKTIAAICAAPTALKAHKIGLGKKMSCYPSLKNDLVEGNDYQYVAEKVVTDGNVITSQGPGTAYDFALTLVRRLVGDEKATSVAKGLLLDQQ